MEFRDALANTIQHSRVFHALSDKAYLKLVYRLKMGKRLSLKRPTTFTEKLQWLKLHDRNPLYSKLVDKYRVRDYVKEKIGEEHLIPLLGKWDSFDEIDFDSLPDRFVLKCNHDSGSVVICRDKATFDKEAARAKLTWCLNRNMFYFGREWPYKNVKPCILAEPFLEETGTDSLTDYKFFCFEGKPAVMYLSHDKAGDPRTDFFDMERKHLPFHMKDPNAEVAPELPQEFDEMKQYAEVLSRGFAHVRVDFYVIGHRVYFGELTFYHCSGFASIVPAEWDRTLGEKIPLPANRI